MRLSWLVLLAVVATQVPAWGAEWAMFTHPEPPFTIYYPAEWVRLTADKLALLVVVAPNSRGLGLVAVGVPLKAGESLNDLEPQLSRIIPQRFSAYQPLRTDRTTLSGRPALIHYFTGVRNGAHVYVMLATVTTASHGYMLFGMTAVDSPHLRAELVLLQRIIVGFRPSR